MVRPTFPKVGPVREVTGWLGPFVHVRLIIRCPRFTAKFYYANPDWLIIDEFGFDKIERAECPEAAHLLYKIIASRNQKRSTAVVTNVDFDKWGDYLSDGPLAMAFLDRLVEGAIILKVKGKSYRAEKAKATENHST